MICCFTLADAIIVFAYVININADRKNIIADAINITAFIINIISIAIN